jgi:hypothetical protein
MPELRGMRTRNLHARTELRETRAEPVKDMLAAAVEIDGHPLRGSFFAHLEGQGRAVWFRITGSCPNGRADRLA